MRGSGVIINVGAKLKKREELYNLGINCIRYCISIIFIIFVLVAFVIKPVYNFQDYPEFDWMGINDYIVLILVVIVFFLIFKFRLKLDIILKKKIIVIVFFMAALSFIFLLPLKPFSDMLQIYEGAITVHQEGLEYFKSNVYYSVYPNNIMTALFYSLLYFGPCKSDFLIKISNMFIVLGTAFFSCKILEIYSRRYNNIFFFIIITFLSVFMYINHVYNDLLVTFFCSIGLFIYVKNSENIWISTLIFSLMYFFRPTAMIFCVAMGIDFLLKGEFNKEMAKKGIVSVILMISILVIINNMFISKIVNEQIKSTPIWSFIYMGFNEDEFGFQDGSHSSERTATDVKNRIAGYGGIKTSEILGKKSYWTWMEGTYQAARYAFGENTSDWQKKYYYKTILTPHFMTVDQKLPSLLNRVMRSQYYCFFIMLIIGILKKPTKEFDFYYLSFFGFFLFYLFWEMKSRYILTLYPIMLIVGFYSLIQILDNKNKIKRVQL